MNKTIITFLLFLPIHVYGNCLNEINNKNDLVISNICNYEVTVAAKINSVSLNNKYNPLTYFKNHRTYTINASVEEGLKGNIKGEVCFVQRREKPFENIYTIKNNTFIISYNKNKGCSLIEVGSILKANETLLKLARNAQVQ